MTNNCELKRTREAEVASRREQRIREAMANGINAYVVNGADDVAIIAQELAKDSDIRIVDLATQTTIENVCSALGIPKNEYAFETDDYIKEKPKVVIMGLDTFILENETSFRGDGPCDLIMQLLVLGEKYSSGTLVACNGSSEEVRDKMMTICSRVYWASEFIASFGPLAIIH